MTVEETFTLMQQSFNPASAVGLQKSIQWNITGDKGSVYTIRIQDGVCALLQGATEHPDLSITVSDENWIAMAEEHLGAMKAFLTGKVQAKGDMTLAMRIPNLFPRK